MKLAQLKQMAKGKKKGSPKPKEPKKTKTPPHIKLANIADREAMLAIDLVRFPDLVAKYKIPPKIAKKKSIAEMADQYNAAKSRELIEAYNTKQQLRTEPTLSYAIMEMARQRIPARRAYKVAKGFAKYLGESMPKKASFNEIYRRGKESKKPFRLPQRILNIIKENRAATLAKRQ